MKKGDDKNTFILQCRFFNGEKEAPEWMNQNEKMFWFYEECWVTKKLNGGDYSCYLIDHPSIKDFEVYDETPQDLKALICDRYCHIGGDIDGFKDMYKLSYQTRLTNKLRIDKEWELRHCRLYSGNGENVYEQLSLNPIIYKEPENSFKENKTKEEIQHILFVFYSNEKLWVLSDDISREIRIKYAVPDFEHCVGADFEGNDGTPKELKAWMFEGFLDWVDGVYNRFSTSYEIDLFKRYYREYYQPILTPNQKRDQERRPGLIDKCKYYKGETTNPWEYCFSPVLVYRKNIWNIEKEWVDAMVGSYTCPQSSKQLIKDFVLTEFFKSKGISMSLINHIINKEKAETEKRKEYYGPAEAIKTYEKYVKLTPLGRDHRMYFAFYLGEEGCPYDLDDEEYKRMGWTQEKMQYELTHWLQDFNDESFQSHRGEEGIWGWYADPKFPDAQKQIVFFAVSNWGMWCPYCNDYELTEKYLNYHYPGE